MKALQTLINGKSNKENALQIIDFLQKTTDAQLTLNSTKFQFDSDGTMYKINDKAAKTMLVGDVRRGRAISNLRKSLLAAFDNKNSKVVLWTGADFYAWEHNHKQAPSQPQPSIKTSSKGVKFVCTLDWFKAERRSKNENGDCAVRAIAAGFDIAYNKVHDVLAGFGRYTGYGTSLFQMKDAINELAGREIKMEYAGMTVKQALRKYNKGNFIVVVRGHAFSIKDGVVFGNGGYDAERMRARIKYVWEI